MVGDSLGSVSHKSVGRQLNLGTNYDNMVLSVIAVSALGVVKSVRSSVLICAFGFFCQVRYSPASQR
jgi:hypothetical protein